MMPLSFSAATVPSDARRGELKKFVLIAAGGCSSRLEVEGWVTVFRVSWPQGYTASSLWRVAAGQSLLCHAGLVVSLCRSAASSAGTIRAILLWWPEQGMMGWWRG
jgi:hypothetical protein